MWYLEVSNDNSAKGRKKKGIDWENFKRKLGNKKYLLRNYSKKIKEIKW